MTPSDISPAEASHGSSRDPGCEPLACVSCRSRKLKCDRVKPVCSRCAKVKGDCVYPESRRKPASKRRNVQELEARLAQVEDLLKDSGKTSPGDEDAPGVEVPLAFGFGDLAVDPETVMNLDSSANDDSTLPPGFPGMSGTFANLDGLGQGSTPSSRELIDLGLFETLPPFEVMEELNQIFFRTQYHAIPIIHFGRYTQAFYSIPQKRPPMCLQYAIWTMASNGHEKYATYHDIFYRRARHYADCDEMRGYGEHFMTLAHAQTWALLATDEARNMFFTRASMSCAKCVRLVEMMGLHRLDGPEELMAPVIGPPASWTELEERRRTFWGAFCIDSHASISSGWPMLIDMTEITTKLPASEDAFAKGQEESTCTIQDAFKGAEYSTFASVILTAYLFNLILKHVHRPKPNDHPEDVDYGQYWNRHRDLDNTLSSAFMFLPERFRFPRGLRDPSATYINLNLHAAVICLHHAAIEKIAKHKLPGNLKASSDLRLKTATDEIINIVRLTSHLPMTYKSPLVALSMYCATSVYIYQAKDDPQAGLSTADSQNLEFIIRAMEAVGKDHLITRAFLQQVALDVERNNLQDTIRIAGLEKYRGMFGDGGSIPLIVRSSVTKHTQIQSPLPGRLPLGNPRGSILNLSSKQFSCENVWTPKVDVDDVSGNKRKRMSPDPAVSATNTPPTNTLYGPPITNPTTSSLSYRSSHAPDFHIYMGGGGGSVHPSAAKVTLAHRTSSSSSSPLRTTSSNTGSSSQTPAHAPAPAVEEEAGVFGTQAGGVEWQSPSATLYVQEEENLLGGADFDASPVGQPWNMLSEIVELDWSQDPPGG